MKSNKKPVRIISVVVFVLLGLYIFLTGVYNLRFQSGYDSSRVRIQDFNAANIQHTLSEYVDILNIPKDAEIIITGEVKKDKYGDLVYILAYANSIVPQNTMLSGNVDKKLKPTAYWAAKISNGIVTEAWYAVRPILNEEIHPYTDAEQLKKVEFVTLLTAPSKFIRQPWLYDRDLIGYSDKCSK